MKKLLLIVNPMAGKSMYKEGLGDALAILAKGGYETTIRFTEGTGHAAALAQESPAILMDEPTTFLDIAGQLRLAQTIRSLADAGKTMILVLHDLPLALKLSDRLAVLHEGHLLDCGTPEEILARGSLERAYGIKIRPIQTEDGTDYVCGL
jgi:ABC-type cobalamin/Fe3+-siderophores transport system ATPase subunit